MEHWEQIAQQNWRASGSTSAVKTIDPEFLRTQIWAPLELEDFSMRSLLPLEDLQILERYLWPAFSEDSSNHHVLLIAAFVNVKRHANLDSWSVFSDRQPDFTILFQRILSLCLDTSLSAQSKLFSLSFVVAAFQSLEQEFVRKECAPLVSIAIWHNIHTVKCRDKELQKGTARQKAWRSMQKRFESADKATQTKMQFDRGWLYSMVLDFFRRINTDQVLSIHDVMYCERVLEFITDLISQLPTRRYTIVLLENLNILPVLKTSKIFGKESCATLNDLTALYQHFSNLKVDESSSQGGTAPEQDDHYRDIAQLQRVAFQHFEQKLKLLALSNNASINSPEELRSHLSTIDHKGLEQFCSLLDFRTSYPANSNVPITRALLEEVLVSRYCKVSNFRQDMGTTAILPTEQTLYDEILLRNETYDGVKPLALPKLNLQYLSLDDFMWRSFQLQQTEAFYEIRKDMESIVRRMKPRLARDTKGTHFDGFSKMALPIDKPAVIEVGPAKVGSVIPSFVRAEVILDVSRLNDSLVAEWESIRPRDTIFLLSVQAGSSNSSSANSRGEKGSTHEVNFDVLRTADVVQILDDKGRSRRDLHNGNGYSGKSRRRHLLLDLDPLAYHNDQIRLSRGKPDVWNSINILARRQGRENNFKPMLETIQQLVRSNTQLPFWLQDVYLGYGDPKSASYPDLMDKVGTIDYLDTFLDWQHLQESFPGQVISAVDHSKGVNPPYVLQLSTNGSAATSNPKKRRRDHLEGSQVTPGPVRVSTYDPPNTGPYPVDIVKKNSVRFTPNQVRAIVSGVQPGLSLVVGPPGTGKTDVATQIINLLYHNFPAERILLIAHSNQALNQLFQKIIALDIDARHLLRLGHGHEELDTESSYSKHGRVESFMENRQAFLSEVNRLAASVGAAGAHGSTCETADYFHQAFVQPAWSQFWSIANSGAATPQTIIDAFPFKKFFSNAPTPDLLPVSSSVEHLREIATGCQHHLDKLFRELESIHPFEILRNPRDQANHLLVKEARIIAMTSTHAAIRRHEIAELGFHYDTLVMEEAAQITEVESFIPCAMQNPDARTGAIPLKRIVLVGDHLQNSPVVQNLALRQYANFEQSLFLRLVRLGVPTITLDQQGRCRPSIAELFNWRYDQLTTLPHLMSLPEFQRANAGFRYEYQFIDVGDYQGHGEREPTPHFIQNVGEAEYAVALYQYMRLLGYPARSISILAMYAGQKALIRDVLNHRCKGNRLFGLPRIVTTVDKYQGEQNDYVILSLVRTKSVGYLRDVRRLTVALSRARLGLYVFGRQELFENCLEMKTAMKRLSMRGDSAGKLALVTGEMFPATRGIDDDVSGVAMEGVEHLGQYVYEMTQAKIQSIGGVSRVVNTNGDAPDGDLEQDGADELVDEADLEEDPLHEGV